MDTENFKLDIGHIWIPITKAQEMLEMKNYIARIAVKTGLNVIIKETLLYVIWSRIPLYDRYFRNK